MVKKKLMALMIGMVFCFSAAIASASLSEGSISSPDKIYATDGWTSGVTLAWIVVPGDIAPGESGYIYTYTWTSPTVNGQIKEISHLDISVSEGFLDDNVFGVYKDGEACAYDIGEWNTDNIIGNTFKFDAGADKATVVYTLYTDKAPMWGDFYAKDGTDSGTGTDVYAYNISDYKIAVPDTDTVVPIPSAVLLLGPGLIGLIGIGRKFKK